MRAVVYNRNLHVRGGGERRALVLAAHLRRRAEVWIVSSFDVNLGELEQYFGVELSGVRVLALGAVDEREAESAVARLGPEVLINNSYRSNLRNSAPRGVYMCMFPHACGEGTVDASASGSARLPSDHPLRSYTSVTANSLFTRRWIRRLWGLDATVVYSPCDAGDFPAQKERRILHVGRFSDPRQTPHRKRQDILIEAFAGMRDLHEQGWRLDLAGSLDPGAEAVAEVQRLRQAAAGLPVDFHPEATRETLRRLYRDAAVYWHATGFGSRPDEAPEQQEHFGVSIVEAMSAGAVPVVRDAGGPREIVRNGFSGHRWTELEELVSRTRALAGNPAGRERMSRRAVLASRRFSREKFLRRVDRVLDS